MNDTGFKVSFSSLDTYKTCQRKYYYGYVLKLPKIDRPWFLFGNFNHLVLEKFFKYILFFNKRNKSFDRKELMYRAFQSAKKKFDRLASFGKQPYLTSQQVNESKKILRRFFKRRVEMENQVFAVEKEIKIDLGDGMHLVGYIDRIDKVKDGEYVIVDYKTSKTPYDINKNNQLDIYALGFIQALGGPNIKVHKQLDFIKAGSVTPRQLHDNLANEQIENNLYDLASEIRDKKTTEHNNAEAWIPHDNDFCWACDFKDRCYRDRGITESIFGDD